MSERPMSVKLYGELDLPENAGGQKLDRIILYTLGEDGAIRVEGVRAINRPATRRLKPRISPEI